MRILPNIKYKIVRQHVHSRDNNEYVITYLDHNQEQRDIVYDIHTGLIKREMFRYEQEIDKNIPKQIKI